MQFKLYRFLTKYFSFLIRIYLNYRLAKGKEDFYRFSERLGKASVKRPKGMLIWFHAASVGESVSVLPLIFKITKNYPSLNILVTTGTLTSAKIMAGRLPKNAIHQFIPVDSLSAVTKFLRHWRPDLALWIESELWPNLIVETQATGCPLILINGRISDESYRKWKNNLNFAREILSKFSLCLVQTDEDQYKYSDIGAPKVITAGNLKYEAPPLPGNPEEFGRLIKQVGNRPIWLAASTHNGEEEIILNIHKNLSAEFPDLLTIIMPRHPRRSKDIAALIQSKSLKYSQRSKKEKLTDKTSIYIVDTIGELGIFYRLANIIFMGGSLVKHGGQNPLEAGRLECAILSGENYFNFAEVYEEMRSKKSVIIVKNEEGLTNNIRELLSDNKLQRNYAYTAKEFVESKRGVLSKYLENIEPYLKPISLEK